MASLPNNSYPVGTPLRQHTPPIAKDIFRWQQRHYDVISIKAPHPHCHDIPQPTPVRTPAPKLSFFLPYLVLLSLPYPIQTRAAATFPCSCRLSACAFCFALLSFTPKETGSRKLCICVLGFGIFLQISYEVAPLASSAWFLWSFCGGYIICLW